ncbi:MAG TPA: hypothetical protein VF188_05055 [Longimicrobiales bacterium]
MRLGRVGGSLAAAAILCSTTVAAGQSEDVLRGRVIGPEGLPVAGAAVALHHVSPTAGGAEVGRAIAGPDGSFEVRIPPGTAADGVFFAATRFDGKLYMGVPFRKSDGVPSDYVIAVRADAGIAAGPAVPGGAAPRPLPWWVAVPIGLAALWVVARPLLPAGRAYAARSLLLALAELEERSAARAPGGADEDHAERAALRARLRTITGTVAAHAADQH